MVKKSFLAYFSRLAARHPAFSIFLATGCLLAGTLLAALALWPEMDSGNGRVRMFREFQHRESGSMREKNGVSPAEDAPLPSTKIPAQTGLAIVIDDMGENMRAVHALLDLRIPVSLAVWPHARFARETALAAHAAGCAILIHQPMEALRANIEPGANPLRAGMSRDRMESVFQRSLAGVPHAEGLNNHMGSRFTTRREDVRNFCEIVADSGLFVLDSVTHPTSVLYEEALVAGIAAARRDIFLDAKPGKSAVLASLREAARLASRGKQIIAIGHPLKETLAALREWNSTRDPGLRLLSLRDCLTAP